MPDIPNRDALENELARKLARLFAAFVGHVMELIGNGEITATNIPADVMDQLTADEKAVLLPFLERVAMESAERLQDEIPIGTDWALVNEAAASWARDYAFTLVSQIDNTGRRKLQRAISQYFEQSMTIGDLRQSLARVFGPRRAEAIAVTEVTRAASQGEQQLARELAAQGIVMIPIHQTNADELVCPICNPRHNKEITDGRYPPLHPRCRCWVNHELPKG